MLRVHRTALKGIMGLALGVGAMSSALAGEARYTADLSLRESYDNNVYLQDHTDLAERDSLITTITPKLGLTLRQEGAKDPWLRLGYAPAIVFFHSEHSEDHVAHNFVAQLTAAQGPWKLDFANSILKIDGEDRGVIFTGEGGAPAAGGPAIRDRRDAAVYKSALTTQYTQDRWFIRPLATAYIHDFQTDHLSTPGYLNYVDRYELAAGVDVGVRVLEKTHLVAGYRYGYQHQSELLDSPVNYSNEYHRVLGGVEGKPLPWMKISFMGGPDFRSFCDDVSSDFEDHQTKLYIDGTLTLSPTTSDEIILAVRRFEQPGFSGRSVYEDVLYAASWTHAFTKQASGVLGYRAYNTDFELPAKRNDWVHTITLAAMYKLNERLSIEGGWLIEIGNSRLPDTDGRDYRRQMVYAGVSYRF